MCGFVVIVSFGSAPPEGQALQYATTQLAHRGPDDAGEFIEGNVGIGFRRLSILDLSAAGHQPMLSADGRHVIVFNGAIYNFVELRAELEALGHRFTSNGDTEVLMAAYAQWGRDCLPRLNGMWAFVIFDRLAKSFFGARDRFGVKPLFWSIDGGSLVIASEIKAIRAARRTPLGIQHDVLAAFLLDGQLDSSAHTFHAGVQQVPAGTAFDADLSGRVRWQRYWSVNQASDAIPLPSDPPAAFGDLFEDAVRLRMRSDVPVGVLLSGGLDSTSIICSMARRDSAAKSDVTLSALCYLDPEFDERALIDATVAQTRASLLSLDITPQTIWDTMDRLIWHQDGPVHSINAILGFHLMRMAHTHGIKVMLSGQGADETVAGYRSYFISYWLELMQSGRLIELHRSIRATAQAGWGYARVIEAALGRALRHTPVYAALARLRRKRKAQRGSWINDELRAHWRPSNHPDVGTLEAALRQSIEHSNLPVYLRVDERNAMAHGVEQRTPFLDHRLVSLAFRLPAEWKLRGNQTKFILREAMRGRIPEVVRTRTQKFGFPVGVDTWFRGPLYSPLKDMLGSRVVREADIWNMERINRALEQHRSGATNVGAELFDVAQVSLWLHQVRGVSHPPPL